MLGDMNRETRLSIAWLAGSLVYLLALYIQAYVPSAPGPTISSILAAIVVAALARRAMDAFIVGAAAGLTALIMAAGAWITKSLAIVSSAGGGLVALLAVLYHPLAPGLLAAGLTLFFREKK